MTETENDPRIKAIKEEDVSTIFKYFGDRGRLGVLIILKGQENPLTFAQIRRKVNDQGNLVPASTVSNYLEDLRTAGLVDREHGGASMLSEVGNKIFDMISGISQPLLFLIMEQKLAEVERLTIGNIENNPESREEMEQMLNSIASMKQSIRESLPQ